VKSRLALVAACCLALAACGTLSMPKIWPFYKKPKPGPEAVNELTLVNADGSAATFPQYWKRNTLVIDLTGAGGQGSLAARLPGESAWPVRVALRVQPGSVGQLEVQGEERNILPVTAEGAKPVDIELASSVYTPNTAAIYISWGPVPVIVESASPEPEAPVFVSPTEVPKPAAGTGGEPSDATPEAPSEAPAASDIVPPGEVAGAQPSPGT
jgi:hypothetical protein